MTEEFNTEVVNKKRKEILDEDEDENNVLVSTYSEEDPNQLENLERKLQYIKDNFPCGPSARISAQEFERRMGWSSTEFVQKPRRARLSSVPVPPSKRKSRKQKTFQDSSTLEKISNKPLIQSKC